MIRTLWLEMKNYLKGNIAVFVLSVLAFSFACITINMTMHNFLEIRDMRREYEESYGSKAFYKIMLPGETAVFIRVYGWDNIENIRAVFEQLKAEPLFEFIYRTENSVEFYDFDDPNFGVDDFPRFRLEFLTGYEHGRTEFSLQDDYLSLKALFTDRLLINEPNVRLSDGRWFTDYEFHVYDPYNIRLPVILGAGYRDLYEIGDIITNAQMGSVNPITLHVIGFLEHNSWFYDNNNNRLLLNRHMIIPQPEPKYDPILGDGSRCAFYRFSYMSVLNNARIVSTQENAEAAVSRVYEIFNEYRQYDFRLFPETDGFMRGIAILGERAASTLAISLFTLVLCVFMFSIQGNYKLNKYKKKYGIYMMNGITSKQLLMIMLQDMVLLFVLSNIITAAVSSITLGAWFQRFYIVSLSIEAVVLLLAMQVFLLCLIGITGHIKVHKIDMSSALRENE